MYAIPKYFGTGYDVLNANQYSQTQNFSHAVPDSYRDKNEILFGIKKRLS